MCPRQTEGHCCLSILQGRTITGEDLLIFSKQWTTVLAVVDFNISPLGHLVQASIKTRTDSPEEKGTNM